MKKSLVNVLQETVSLVQKTTTYLTLAALMLFPVGYANNSLAQTKKEKFDKRTAERYENNPDGTSLITYTDGSTKTLDFKLNNSEENPQFLHSNTQNSDSQEWEAFLGKYSWT